MAKPCWSCVPECDSIGEAKKAQFHAGHRGRQMILQLQQELKAEGANVSLVKLCQWFEMPRRTVYYRPTKGAPKVQEKFVTPIKAMIEENPSFGYRTVAHLLGMNKNTVQRVFQCMGWQVRKRPVGFRPRIQAIPSLAKAPNERWATDLCRVWAGRDGWTSLALVTGLAFITINGPTRLLVCEPLPRFML